MRDAPSDKMLLLCALPPGTFLPLVALPVPKKGRSREGVWKSASSSGIVSAKFGSKLNTSSASPSSSKAVALEEEEDGEDDGDNDDEEEKGEEEEDDDDAPALRVMRAIWRS